MSLTIDRGKLCLFIAALAASPILLADEAWATPSPLFTNLGPGQSFDTGLFQYVQVDGTNAGGLSIGTKFTATASGNLSQVLLPVADSLGVESFFLSNATGAGNTGLGSILESWINVSVPTSATPLSLFTLASVADPFLSSGTTYWFFEVSASTGVALCTPPDGITCPPSEVSPSKGVFWGNALQGTGGFFQGSPTLMNSPQESDPSAAPPAIELDTNVSSPSNSVPEPASVLLLAGSLLGLGFVTHRKRAA